MGKKKNGWNRMSDGWKFYKDGEVEVEYRIKELGQGHFQIFELTDEENTNLGKDFPTKAEAEHWLAQKVREDEDEE